MRFFILLYFLSGFLLLSPAVQGQGLTGKWRWVVRGSDKDLQADYLLELDLKQDGNRVYGTRTLYLKDYDNMIVWMEGNITGRGQLTMTSKNLVQYHLPDSILAAKQFSFQFEWSDRDKGRLTGLYTPVEDTSKRRMRMLDPYFYDMIYKVPMKSMFVRLADTVSNAFREIIQKQLGIETAIASTPTVPSKKPAIETEVEHILHIPAADVHIELYDNGTIDGDIVTVFVNNRVVSAHQKLGIAPIQIQLDKEELGDSTMIIMQAENLGDIPPNTALMLITVNGKRYDLNISSTLEKRAAVILYRKK